MININKDRLLEDLDTLRTFGGTGSGVVRPSLSDVDMESRHWLIQRFAEKNMSAEIDGVGTVLARSPNPGPALLIGSHTDTQPTGGWLDGALGVIYGLEVARSLLEHDATRHLSVDVASWIDEEGTYFGCLGSKAFCGHIGNAHIDSAKNQNGDNLRDALSRHNLADRPRFDYQAFNHSCYVEAHIEQGPRLEAEGKRIGVVTDIVGSRNILIEFLGQQNHAGTTPMALRRNALNALIDFAHRVNRDFPQHVGPRSVWTMGRIEVEPNAPSIIPGCARLHLQFRDPEESRLDALQATVLDWVDETATTLTESNISVTAHPRTDNAVGVAMDATLMSHLGAAAQKLAPGDWIQMPSGAVHDAQVLASRMPSAMLFIPSIGGVSHAFEEDSSREDIALGCEVLANGVASYLLESA